MGNRMVGIRFSATEYETIKSLSKATGLTEMAVYCRDVIRRYLKNPAVFSENNLSGTQPPLIVENGEPLDNAEAGETILASSTLTGNDNQDDDSLTRDTPPNTTSPNSSEDEPTNDPLLHLVKVDRDVHQTRTNNGKQSLNEDTVHSPSRKAASEDPGTPAHVHDEILTVLDDTIESFHASMEQIRTGMESVVKNMQLTFEQTAAGGLLLVRETNAAVTSQIEKAYHGYSEKLEQIDRDSIALLKQQLSRYEELGEKEIQASKTAQTLIRDDLKGTRKIMEESMKITIDEFRCVLNHAVSVLKNFRVETLKLKRSVWLTAALTMFFISTPGLGWLVYKYETQNDFTNMWHLKAQRINQYVMDNFYPVLDAEGKRKINDYYNKLKLTTPEEQKGALE